MVRQFLDWFQKWDNLSEVPETEFDYDREWEFGTPFEYLQSKIDLRGSTQDLEAAHEAIVRSIHESSLNPSNILYSSEGERKRINETIKDYQSLADDIRQELFSRSMAISINEKLKDKKAKIVTGAEPPLSDRHPGMLWDDGSKVFIWTGSPAEWQPI
jgi:hypothetical protein